MFNSIVMLKFYGNLQYSGIYSETLKLITYNTLTVILRCKNITISISEYCN